MMKTLAIAVTVCLACTMVAQAEDPSTIRPASWAKSMQLAGVPNLHRVTTNLYRSAQPTAEGMRNLAQLGIKTVINLRSFQSDHDEVAGTPLKIEHIRMKARHPETEDVVAFLRIVISPTNGPVLVHCQHGSDRTGVACALYRVAVQGWTREEALQEMAEGGFGFHSFWQNLPPWIEHLDVQQIKRDAGMKTRAEPAAAP